MVVDTAPSPAAAPVGRVAQPLSLALATALGGKTAQSIMLTPTAGALSSNIGGPTRVDSGHTRVGRPEN